jgi:HlyD family secretion protein
MVHKERQPLVKPLGRWHIFFIIITAIVAGAVSIYGASSKLSFSSLRDSLTQAPPLPKKATPVRTSVAALGRLEPEGEVINLSAPNSLGGVRIAKLLVKQTDRVTKGQMIATLDGYNLRLAALEQAKKQVLVSQAKLAQVKVGAKAGDISAQKATIARLEAELRGQESAQKATIARLEAELRNSQSEDRRYQQLYKEGAISASDSDARKLRVDTVQQQLNEAIATQNRTTETLQKQLYEAKAKLTSIAEVRPTDIQLAQADVESTQAGVKQAQADLDLTIVRSPIDGQILKVHTRPGEVIGSQGILDIGKTNRMYVVAEIYETDIEKVRLGQSATITGNAFSGKLKGKVTDIGLQVSKQNIFNNNPGADTDNKIIDVKIRLDNASSQRVSALTDLQVEVLIRI